MSARRLEDLRPPYVLAGDSWAFLGLASARRVRAEIGDARLLGLFGLAVVVLQATRYTSARPLEADWSVAYSELSVTAIVLGPRWSLAPVKLLVDEPLSKQIGDDYGFRKEVVPLQLTATDWTLRLAAGDGRYLNGARGLGALLLWPLARALASMRLGVVFPKSSRRTAFAFEAVQRVAPALGIVTAPLADWACGAFIWPIGVAIQGVRFLLEEPRE